MQTGDGNPNTGPFTLQAGSNRAAGTVTLGSCRYTVSSSTIATLPLGTAIVHDPCEIDASAYRGTNTANNVTANSATPTPAAFRLATPSNSSTIALTSDDRRLLVVNREANTVSFIEVRSATGQDVASNNVLAEMAVGLEPRCVALHPNDQEAYVTNGVSGTVSVVSLTNLTVVAEIAVGTEPRGCAITPNGTQLYVANHTAGTVRSLILTARTVVIRPVRLVTRTKTPTQPQ